MFGVLRNRRVLFGGVFVAALAAVAVWPRAIEVEISTVRAEPMVATIDEDGRTRVRDRFVVTAPVAGEVLRIGLQVGDRVEKGRTVLATIRAVAPMPLDGRSRTEAEAAVRATEAAVGRAKAERDRAAAVLRLAEREAARVRTLVAGGAVAREELESRETNLTAAVEVLRGAEFAAAGAEHELAMARARLLPVAAMGTTRDWVVRAPVDGVVLSRQRESQSVVAAGEVLLELGDPSRLEVVVDLLSSDAVRVKVGSRVLIEDWGGPTALEGRVRRIEPAGFTKVSALGVEEQRVNVVVDLDHGTEAARSLGDNFRVEVRIVQWESESALQVSPGALYRQGEGWGVFVVDAGVARARAVTIGYRHPTAVEVRSGLAAGDTVIVYPPDTLGDGAKVTVREQR